MVFNLLGAIKACILEQNTTAMNSDGLKSLHFIHGYIIIKYRSKVMAPFSTSVLVKWWFLVVILMND